MTRTARLAALLLLASFATPVVRVAGSPQGVAGEWASIAADPRLQSVLERARDAAVERFADAGLTADGLAITVVDVTDPVDVDAP